MNMNWIKKNWIVITIVAIVIAVIIYFIIKKRKASKSSPTGNTGKKAADLKKLADCEANTKNVRLSPGQPHPCAALRDMVANESSFSGPFTKTNSLNVEDFSMGLQGTSLLEDKELNYGKAKPKKSATGSSVGGGVNVTN